MTMAEIKVPIQINLPDDWVEQIVERLRNDPELEEPEPCEDVVSRQAVYTVIEEVLYETTKGADNWYGLLNDGVRTLPSVTPKPQWVPCSERLPEIKEHHVSDPCLVYCDTGECGYAYGFSELEENIFGQTGWSCERDDEYHEPLGKVIAWTPLPEPYQKEGEEDESD